MQEIIDDGLKPGNQTDQDIDDLNKKLSDISERAKKIISDKKRDLRGIYK